MNEKHAARDPRVADHGSIGEVKKRHAQCTLKESKWKIAKKYKKTKIRRHVTEGEVDTSQVVVQ